MCDSHIIPTRDINMCGSHVILHLNLYHVHMWSSHMNSTYGAYGRFTLCMWCSHVQFTYEHHIRPVHFLYLMLTCDIHIWTSHTDTFIIYTMFTCDVHIWFVVCLYMMFVCDVHMWFHIWFVVCLYMMFVCDVHLWSSTGIIYSTVYDHMRKTHVIWLHAYDVHVWTYTHMMFTCEHFFRWDAVISL